MQTYRQLSRSILGYVPSADLQKKKSPIKTRERQNRIQCCGEKKSKRTGIK